MKKIITYHSIEYGAGLFAIPQPTHQEIVEVKSEAQLKKYIEAQKDQYGHNFKFKKKRRYGFDYISNQGGVKVSDYKPPRIKKI